MAQNVIVNKWLDFADRVGWTAIYALAAAAFTVLTSSGMGWEEALKFIGISVAFAVVKVIIGQRTGSDDTGAVVLGAGPVVEEPR